MALIIALRNITGLSDVSDYEYGVYINETLLEKGSVFGHKRAEGWAALLQRLLDERKNNPDIFHN